MARIRQIKPSFFVDDDVATLSLGARLMFVGMWCLADREGRLEDKPLSIKLQTLPLDQLDPAVLLAELAAKGLIDRYSVRDKRYISIHGFTKHQHPHQNEAASSLPGPMDRTNLVNEVKPTAAIPPKTGTYSNGRSAPVKVDRTRADSDTDSDTDTDKDQKGAAGEPPLFEKLLERFRSRWAKSYKRPYPVQGADNSNLGRFMRQNPQYIEGWPSICDRYLSDRQQFTIDKSGNHSLSWLVTKGLAKYGGTPRESYEEATARFQREHAKRKALASRPSTSEALNGLVKDLANAHSEAPYNVDQKENEARNRIAAQLAARKAAEGNAHG